MPNKPGHGADGLVQGQDCQDAPGYKNPRVAQPLLPGANKDGRYYTYGDNRTEQAAKAYWDRIKQEG